MKVYFGLEVAHVIICINTMAAIVEHPDSIRNDTDSKTLTRVVMSRTKSSDFVILLNSIQTACKLISRSVRKAGIAGLCELIYLMAIH